MRRIAASAQILVFTLVFLILTALTALVAAAEPAQPPARSRTVHVERAARMTLAQKLAQARTDQEWLEMYMIHFANRSPHYPPNKRLKKKAPELSETLRAYARGYAIPYQVAAVVMRCESGFQESIQGRKDARDFGLYQVNRRIHRKLLADLDLETAEGQIEAGLRVLEQGYQLCGSWRGAIAFYSAGLCKVPQTHRKASNVKHRYVLLSRAGYPIDKM